MKKRSGLCWIIITTLILTGVSGCMGKVNQEEKIDIMKKYAEEKYNENYKQVSFIRAVDETRSDVLTLSKGNDFIFNVYHRGVDSDYAELYDDYNVETVNQQFCDYFAKKSEFQFGNAKMNAIIELGAVEYLSTDKVKDKTVEQLIDEFGLTEINVMLMVEEEKGWIENHAQQLFDAYNYLEGMLPERNVIFQVVVGSLEDEKLMNCITNPEVYYDNDWYEYKSVKEYLFVADDSIKNLGDFVEGIEEVH